MVFLSGSLPARHSPAPTSLMALPELWDCSPEKAPPHHPQPPLDKAGAPSTLPAGVHPQTHSSSARPSLTCLYTFKVWGSSCPSV